MFALRPLAVLLLLAAAPALAAPGYVKAGATGGALDDAADPFGSIAAALDAGADELRIAVGQYAGDVAVSGDVPFRSWNGEAGAAEVLDVGSPFSIVGDLSVAAGATVTIVGAGIGFTVTGDLVLEGTLDIQENLLAINGREPANEVRVGPAGDLVASDAAGRSPRRAHIGLLLFNGDGDTDVVVETSASRLRFDFPAIEVSRGSGTVSFDATGVPPQGGDARPDVLGTRALRVVDADGTATNGPVVEMREHLDRLDVALRFDIIGGDFDMLADCSASALPQEMQTGGDFSIQGGSFSASACRTQVGGAFALGDGDTGNGDALFSLRIGGLHTVVGDFTVEADGDYRQGFGDAEVAGDFTFLGVADGAGSGNTGIFGDLFFVGDVPQAFAQRDSPDAYLDDVVFDGAGGLVLASSLTTNEFGRLTFSRGILDASAASGDVVILNPDDENDLSTRNNSVVGGGVVQLGSRDSYVNGTVERRVRHGADGSGSATGGYLFPVGTDTPPEPTPGGAEFFRPLLLQFNDDLAQPAQARVEYLDSPPAVDATPVTDGAWTGEVLSDAFWQIEFDRIPDFDPNVRVAAPFEDAFEGWRRRPPFDVLEVRIVQWDCDGTNPRLAGTFEGDAPGTALRVAKIDDLYNVSQHDVDVEACTLLGLATTTENLTPTASADGPDGDVTLAANVPNPFRDATELRFTLPAPTDIRLTVFDVLGRAVGTLAAGPHAAGAHTAAWDGRDGAGQPAAAGVYLVRLDIGGASLTRTVLRVR